MIACAVDKVSLNKTKPCEWMRFLAECMYGKKGKFVPVLKD
jgi:hypothetical protein